MRKQTSMHTHAHTNTHRYTWPGLKIPDSIVIWKIAHIAFSPLHTTLFGFRK